MLQANRRPKLALVCMWALVLAMVVMLGFDSLDLYRTFAHAFTPPLNPLPIAWRGDFKMRFSPPLQYLEREPGGEVSESPVIVWEICRQPSGLSLKNLMNSSVSRSNTSSNGIIPATSDEFVRKPSPISFSCIQMPVVRSIFKHSSCRGALVGLSLVKSKV